MTKNTKGLSTIVATLLIILLTLVAVGIIWVVVKNVVQGGTEQVDIDAKCLQASVVATKVVNTTAAFDGFGNYEVTLTREGSGDAIGGVRLVFMNASESVSEVIDVDGNLQGIQTRTSTVTFDEVTNPNQVTAVAYFLDADGNAQLCSSNRNEYKFTL